MVRCVAFDLDDTLFLERDYVRSGFEAVGSWVAARLRFEGFAPRAWHAFEAGTRGSVFNDVLAEASIECNPELLARMVEVYRSHRPSIAPLADAVACLAALKGRARLGVVSDGPLASQRAKAEALDAADWAMVTVLTEELGVGFGKPDPRSFALVENATGAEPARCTYVADNPAKDFAGPHARGWQTIRVRRPLSLHEAVDSGPDVDLEVTDLSALPSLLR